MTTDTTPKTKLPAEIQSSIWLAEVRLGTSLRAIALQEQVSLRHVERRVKEARRQEEDKTIRLERIDAEAARRRELGIPAEATPVAPRLVPLFPIGPLVPTSKCGHNGPLRAGSSFCCMICHTSGKDDHPALQRDPKTDPTPEPMPRSLPATTDPALKSSRRRLKQHRHTQAAAAPAS
jgi:hypothetical protein